MIEVLIADDEIIVRKAIRKMGIWEKYGMEVVGEAENGIQVLEFIRKKMPDVLILDMCMPGVSGERILEILEEEKIRIKVVVVSGYDSFEYARKALRYGVADYILKPIDRTEFNEILKKISEEFQNKRTLPEREKSVCDKIKEQIEKDYRNDISLSYFAENYFLNKDALSRMYKKKFGTGITEYINKVRLEQAKILLLLGYSISKTSDMVGYKDVNYFSRIFKKKYDISPTEFIKMEKE